MRTGLSIAVSLAIAGLAVQPGYAQYHPATNKAVAQRPPTHASPAFRRGTIGGPANKPSGIGGAAPARTKTSSPAVRPRF